MTTIRPTHQEARLGARVVDALDHAEGCTRAALASQARAMFGTGSESHLSEVVSGAKRLPLAYLTAAAALGVDIRPALEVLVGAYGWVLVPADEARPGELRTASLRLASVAGVVAELVADATDADGPGGARITAAEARAIRETLTQAEDRLRTIRASLDRVASEHR